MSQADSPGIRIPAAGARIRLSLGAKLLLLVLLPIAILLGVTVPLVVNGLVRLESDTSVSRLRDEVAIISQQFARAGDEIVLRAKSLAGDPTFLAAVERGDSPAIQESLLAAIIRSDLDYLLVLDANGRPIGSEQQTHVSIPIGEFEYLRSLDVSKIRSTRLLETDEGWMLTAIQPVTRRTGLLGMLVAGRLFDSLAVSQLNFNRPDPVLVFFDSQGKATTAAGSGGHGSLERAFVVDRGLWDRALQGQTVLSTSKIQGIGYEVAYGPLVVGDGPGAVFGLALSTEATTALRDRLAFSNLFVIGMVALLAMLAGYLVSRIIRRPIIELQEAAVEIGQGRLDTRVEIASSDEVGSLAAAFNQMADQIAQATETLEDRVRERTRELEEAHELRRLQVAEVARETERKRLAEELHDDTMAALAATALELGLLRRRAGQLSQELAEDCASLITRIRETDRRLRQLVSGIFPSVLTDLGLKQAVRAYLEQMSSRPIENPYPLAIEFTSQGISGQRLPEEVEINLYRVVQQGVTNTIQHAQAKQLWIDMRWVDRELSLSLRDDGRGFDVQNPKETPQSGHFGLLNFRDRIASLKGALEIDSQPTAGTTIRATIPMAAAATGDQSLETSSYVLSIVQAR